MIYSEDVSQISSSGSIVCFQIIEIQCNAVGEAFKKLFIFFDMLKMIENATLSKSTTSHKV